MTRTVTVNFKGLTLVCKGEYQRDELRGFEFEDIKTEHGEDVYDLVNDSYKIIPRIHKNNDDTWDHGDFEPIMCDLEIVVLEAIAAEDAEPKEEGE